MPGKVGDKMEKTIFVFAFLLILISLSFAQNAEIRIIAVEHGKLGKVKLTIGNTGDVPLKDVDMFVDGKKVETLGVYLTPGASCIGILRLTPGKHLIEVKSNGTSDSTTVSIGEFTTTSTIEIEKPKFNVTGKDWITILFVVIIVILGVLVEVVFKMRK